MRQIGVDALPIVMLLAMTIGIILGISSCCAVGVRRAVAGRRRRGQVGDAGIRRADPAILVMAAQVPRWRRCIGSMTVSQEVGCAFGDRHRPGALPRRAGLSRHAHHAAGADDLRRCDRDRRRGPVFVPSLNVTPAAYICADAVAADSGRHLAGVARGFRVRRTDLPDRHQHGVFRQRRWRGVGRATTRASSYCRFATSSWRIIFSFFLNA